MDKIAPTGMRRYAMLATAAFATAMLSGCSVPESAGILIPKPAEFIPALIAFLVIWFVLGKFAWPMIMGTLDARQEKIQADIDAAENARAEALQEKQDYKARIESAHREAGEIVAAAKKEAEKERAVLLAKAQQDAADVVAKSHEALETERRKAMIELSDSVVDFSVEIAGKIIGNELTEQQQRSLAEKYLKEVGKPNE